jgi:hypothetical protein
MFYDNLPLTLGVPVAPGAPSAPGSPLGSCTVCRVASASTPETETYKRIST